MIGEVPDFSSLVSGIAMPMVFLKYNQTHFAKRIGLFVN